MALRTIMIFPKFSNIDKIQKIRMQYDPLYELISPHITLVFPFEDDITNEELKDIMENCLKEIKPFRLVLQGIKRQEDAYGNYLFLDVVEGIDEIVELHNTLYSNIWEKTSTSQKYVPHMTIGKLPSVEEMNLAFSNIKDMDEVFETMVQTVSVEMIGEHEESIIVIETSLKN